MLATSTVPQVLLAIVVGLIVLPRVFWSGRVRDAFRLSISAPAWLVPVAFTTLVTLVLTAFGQRTDENLLLAVYSARHERGSLLSTRLWLDLALVLAMAIGLAGQIGLLRAHIGGRVGTSADFARGVADHTLAILLGKLLLAVAVAFIAVNFTPRGFTALVYLVPNILLAALTGTAALHPERPLIALRAALATGSQQMAGVARIVTAHFLALFVIWSLLGLGTTDAPALGICASSLSHCQSPFLMALGLSRAGVFGTIASGFVSSVCVTAMVLGVTQGFASQAATPTPATKQRRARTTPADAEVHAPTDGSEW